MPEAFGGFRLKWLVSPVPAGIWIGGRPCAPLMLGLASRAPHKLEGSMYGDVHTSQATYSIICYTVIHTHILSIRW